MGARGRLDVIGSFRSTAFHPEPLIFPARFFSLYITCLAAPMNLRLFATIFLPPFLQRLWLAGSARTTFASSFVQGAAKLLYRLGGPCPRLSFRLPRIDEPA